MQLQLQRRLRAFAPAGAGVLALAGVSSAHAAIDVTAITAAGADIALVGAAVFVVYVGIKLYKWIRRAL